VASIPSSLTAGTAYKLPIAGATAINTLSFTPTGSAYPVRVGRSYGSFAWEIAPESAAALVFSACDAMHCTVTLPTTSTPDGATVSTYQLATVADGAVAAGFGREATKARFLIQSTFGPTRATMAELTDATTSTFDTWIGNQMKLEPTLHRAYYRQRTADRIPFGAEATTGGTLAPCDIGSRWHNFAFNSGDKGQFIEVTQNGDGKFELRINTVLRAVVATWTVDVARKPYTICHVQEQVGGAVTVSDTPFVAEDGTCTSKATTEAFTNPANTATLGSSTHHVFAGSDATFTALDNVAGTILLSELKVACPAALATTNARALFVTTGGGATYKLDNRLRIVDNTLTKPTSIDLGASVISATNSAGGMTSVRTAGCPTVTKSFVNKAGCVRKTTCAATEFTSAKFTWDAARVRQFYTVSTKYVYRLSGLRLEQSFATSPCTKNYVSRWWKHVGACGASGATLTPGLTLSTKLTDAGTAMEFTATLQGINAWIGIGLASGSAVSMASGGSGSDVVACDGGVVKRYWVTGYALADGVIVAGSSCTQSSAASSMIFKRPLAAGSAMEIAITPGVEQTVIYAHGADGTTVVAHHAVKGGLSMDLDPTKTATSGAATTGLSADTKATIVKVLGDSTDTANPFVRDVNIHASGLTCTTSSGSNTVGARVEVAGTCWEHVHPDTYNVVDGSFWTLSHPGNKLFSAALNPIRRVAELGKIDLVLPASHMMSRWSDTKKQFPVLGRFGDEVDFKSIYPGVQTLAMAALVGATGTTASTGFEACGSPGEVGNDPAQGHKFPTYMTSLYDGADSVVQPQTKGDSKVIVPASVAVKKEHTDQLRQRTAWALSQIWVMSEGGATNRIQEGEVWHTFRDILTRHAFGNYRNIMREVSYSPMMATYLTYLGNRGYAASGSAPDENYAREIMQLFSIGLYKLNMDGTKQTVSGSSTGEIAQTYDSDDIITFARAWTGFSTQAFRTNLEARNGKDSGNHVDPMKILPASRDVFPKKGLDDGFIGDRYPLCAELPRRQFMHKGASYQYLGVDQPLTKRMDAIEWEKTMVDPARLVLDSTNSPLYVKLCGAATVGGKCAFPSDVDLAANIDDCKTNADVARTECYVDTVRSIQVVDTSTGDTAWYEYVRPPCVELTFFDNAKRIRQVNGNDYIMCADPTTIAAAASCCDTSNPNTGREHCQFVHERVTFATAKARCAAGTSYPTVCKDLTNNRWKSSPVGANGYQKICNTGAIYAWVDAPCTVKAQVDGMGLVNIVHEGEKRTPIVSLGSSNRFTVTWNKAAGYPKASNNCTTETSGTAVPQCVKSGGTCLCDIAVDVAVAFTDLTAIPDGASAERTLPIGAAAPDTFDTGEYTKCDSPSCVAQAATVEVYLKAPANVLDSDTIFKVLAPKATQGTRPVFLLNRVSTVRLGPVGAVDSAAFKFRNPPHFMSFINRYSADMRDAEYETEAVLDHLFFHDNVAPFVAFRLIQRFTTSNPSPRYIEVVATAFKTGTYGGKIYGQGTARVFGNGDTRVVGSYGDLGATVAAVLLDREARMPVLDADPTHGQMREPLLKIYHLLRSMDFTLKSGLELYLKNMDDALGQQEHRQPSVFNFYLPEFEPSGIVREMGLKAPEAMIQTLPKTINYLKGVYSLVTHGLTYCDSGFGNRETAAVVSVDYPMRDCSSNAGMSATSDGRLEYAVAPTATDGAGVVAELSLLLTAGRLSSHSASVIAAAYDVERAASNAATALQSAQMLVATAAEFHTTNLVGLSSTPRRAVAVIPSKDRPYKAVIVMFMNGGCDSFNLLVPHSKCGAHDLFKEYTNIRGAAALKTSELNTIDVPAGTQPCDEFGIHASLPNLARMYTEGNASFIASVGALVEPITKAEFLGRTKRFPSSLYVEYVERGRERERDGEMRNCGSRF
jgi:uncharacterized protein (DUF1800 family)